MNNKKHISTNYQYKRSGCTIYFKLSYKTASCRKKNPAPTHKWLKRWWLFSRTVFSNIFFHEGNIKIFS